MILNWIKAHPVYTFAGVLVIVLLLLWFTGLISGGIERIRANKFDKQQEAYEQQIADLKTERDAIRAERDAAVKRGDEQAAIATLKETESKELRDLIDAKGGQIERAADELDKKLEEARRDAGSCAAAPDQHGCLCAKLKALGFECE